MKIHPNRLRLLNIALAAALAVPAIAVSQNEKHPKTGAPEARYQGAPSGIDPDVGDITYYAPWGNIAIFYKDFGYAGGLVKLGRIDSGLDVLSSPGRLEARIERVD